MSLTHQPCPDCGSSDALTINDDESTKCYSCNKFTPAPSYSNKRKSSCDFKPITGVVKAIPERGLSLETCKKYNYRIGTMNDREVHIATYRDAEGEPKWQKVRFTDKKEFLINPKGKTTSILFGMNLWNGYNKKLIITEGEIDCLSVYQAIGNFPVVSIPNGAAGAKKAIKDNLAWIERFEEVVIMFDMDEPGKKAAKDCAEIISIGKVKIAELPSPYKDPNEMLKAGTLKELTEATWRTKEFRPDGIVFGEELWDEVNKEVEYGFDYPFPSMTKLTYGIRIPEIYAFAAGTGVGKTTIIKEFQYDLFKQGFNIGALHLEDTAKKITLDFMSKECSKQLHIPGTVITEEERRKAFDNTLGTGRIFIYDSKGSREPETIYRKIREMVVAYDCKFIFLDHIKAILDHMGQVDKNAAAEKIVSDLAQLSLELNCTIFIITHLRKSQSDKPFEEGKRISLDDFYGSGALKQYSFYCWGIERNKGATDANKRHLTKLRCLKDRYTGEADGEVITVKFDQETGRLTEVEEVVEAFGDATEGDEEF